MIRIIKIISIVVFVAAITLASLIKINDVVLKDFDVINLHKIYLEKGIPVYTLAMKKVKSAMFIKDIALVKETGSSYLALVSRDFLKFISIGSTVYVPKSGPATGGYIAKEFGAYYTGKVVYVASEPDWQTGFYKIRIQMKEKLPERTFHTAKIVFAVKSNTMMIPITVLENTAGKLFAWVDDNSTAMRIEVKTGVCDGYNCEVLKGLKPGDNVISSDIKKLKPGVLIRNMGENK